MEFGKAFTYVFEDQEWIKKIVIAGLLLLIPFIGGFFLAGWMLETVRRVIDRDPQPLADWSDFGGLLGKGFKAFVVGFVYALPLILISSCAQTLPLMVGENGDETILMAVTAVMLCVSCFSIIYGILLGFIMPAAFANMAAQGTLGAGFRFGEVFGLVKAAPAAYVIVLLGSFLAGILAQFGIILCFIGVLFTAAYATAVNAHLYGQAYNVAKGASY